ncbi:MAG: alpha-L-fucosidase [Planctomycetales bacterium]|nr:alpha-L-fucosidase [Planctomycetales bacterium]
MKHKDISPAAAFLAGLWLFAFMAVSVPAQEEVSSWPYANETKEQKDARMAWWRDARFGLFIHWGVYAVPAGTYKDKQIGGIGEWIMCRGQIPIAEYKQFARQFNPVKYDPDAWVKLAKEAGMKYIVITSKHHDGFALFDSKVTDWDVVDAAPYGKDLLKPLAKACRKHGVKLGFYYSQAQDWTHPGGAGNTWDPAQAGDMDEYIKNIAAPQVKEILTNYGDIAVLWWDTPYDMNKQRADMLQPLIALQPGIITNNRLGGGYPGDTDTPEQHIPATGLKDRDWEACMTMNDTWGFKSYDHNWKSAEMLIQNLVDIASKGGNYLLNVGPTAEGEIPQASVERLKAVGKWMKVNSQSIYGTSASPFAKLTWGRCTQKTVRGKTTLYLHIFDWPAAGKLLVPGLRNEIRKAVLLAGNRKLKTESAQDGVIVNLPAAAPDPVDTVVALQIKGELKVDKILPSQKPDGTVELSAALADIHNPGYGGEIKLETRDAVRNLGYWTDPRCWVEWSYVIDKPGKFEVSAMVAVAEAECPVELIVDNAKQIVRIPSTGGYAAYTKAVLGTVTIDKAGEHNLQLKPIKENWQPANIRTVLLSPSP